MKKYLVQIEFRYLGVPDDCYGSTQKEKYVTIGVYDTAEEAYAEGNKALEVLESKYQLNKNWNRKERFSKNGGAYGFPKTLIANLAYLETPFSFFAKVKTLHYDNLEESINEVHKSVFEYREFKKKQSEE